MSFSSVKMFQGVQFNSYIRITCGVYSILCLVAVVISSNVDTKHAIVFQNTDDPETLFGMTMKLLTTDQSSSWVIVGAPSSNSSHRSYQNISQPGALWKCSLKSSPSCQEIVMDPTGNSKDPLNGVVDRKDHGWLGGSIASGKSNYFVSCASKWINQDTSDQYKVYVMNGICYWRTTESMALNTTSAADLPPNYRLLPLISGSQSGNTMNLGQAGFSVHVPKDNKEIIIGAPGVNAWKGSIARYFDSSVPNATKGDHFTENIIMRPDSSKIKMANNSYFGYSVVSGKFIDTVNQQTHYASGAPRSNNLKGSVLVFYFPSNQQDNWELIQEIKGNQLGSYFGSVLCSVDLNGDDLDDLLIGAPHYSSVRNPILSSRMSILPTKEQFSGYGDEGAIFVYISNGQNLKFELAVSGGNRPWSQFGSSIASIGDINLDGYNDVAIGAPYENDGRGTVYIYHGDSKGLKKVYSQVIHASSIDSGLKGFGSSLSYGLDIDNNGYNDVAIGSYKSSQGVVLRSLPFVQGVGKLKAFLHEAEFPKIPLNTTKFEIESCISFKGQNLPPKIDFQISLSIDVEEKPPRVQLQMPKQQGAVTQYIYEEEVTQNQERCTRLEAIIFKDLEHSGKPVVIRQEISLPGPFNSKINTTTYNITRSSAGKVLLTSSGEGYDAFCKSCPLINPNYPNTFMLRLPLAVMCGDNDICESNLQLDVIFKDVVPGEPFVVGTANSVTLQINVFNEGETAISPSVIVSWTRRKLKKIPPQCQITQTQDPLITYGCDLGRLLENRQAANISLEVDMSDLMMGGDTSHELWFSVEVRTVSEMVIKPLIKYPALRIVRSAKLEFSGSETQEIVNPQTSQRAITFLHSYELKVSGPSSVANISVVIRVPVNLIPPKPYDIFRVHDPKVSGSGQYHYICQNSSDTDTDATMVQASTSLRLRKRDVSDSDNSDNSESDIDLDPEAGSHQILTGGSAGKLSHGGRLNFDCDSNKYIKCQEITCRISVLSSNSKSAVEIKVEMNTDHYRALLREHTASEIRIESKGKLSKPEIDVGVEVPNEIATAFTTIKPESAKPIETWIIIAAVLAGILLFALIFGCLYYFGWIKKRKPPMAPEPEAAPLQGNSAAGPEDDEDVSKDENDAGAPNRNDESPKVT